MASKVHVCRQGQPQSPWKKGSVQDMKKENDDHKRIIGDLTITNYALKKPCRQAEIKYIQDDAR